MSFLKVVASISLLLPSISSAMAGPTISASAAMPSSTSIQASSVPALPVASPTGATTPVQAVAPTPTAAAAAPAPVKPAPAANLGLQSCRNTCGFYGILAGTAAGIPLSRKNGDTMTIIYSLMGGWALGYLTSFFICE